MLLQSVQESYSTLVTALLARADVELIMIFVKQSLLDEEQRRGKSGSVSGLHESRGDCIEGRTRQSQQGMKA